VRRLGWLIAAILVVSCESRSTPPAEPSQAASTASSAPNTPVPNTSQYRIGVRVVDGKGELFDRSTGEHFVPRGNNYIELAQQPDPRGGTSYYHSTFNADLYSETRVEAALKHMQASGYNSVRVFLNGLADSEPGPRFSSAYMRNVIDFLRRAKAHAIFVMFTRDGPPTAYDRAYPPASGDVQNTGGFNSGYAVQYLKAWTTSWADFARTLRAMGAPMDQVFAYELVNEFYFESDKAPFSKTDGTFTTPGQKTYDLSNPAEKSRLTGEWAVSWADAVKAAILAVEPNALVGIGFPSPPDPNDKRLVPIHLMQADVGAGGSTMDFIDFHPYPGVLSLSQHLQKYDVARAGKKPLLMGEFGTGGTASTVASILEDWQVASCAYGFSGWLLWTWDTAIGDRDELVDRALRPADRPDACVASAAARPTIPTAAPAIAARRVKVVSSFPMVGSTRTLTAGMVNAIRMALDEIGSKIGDLAIDYEALDDASQATQQVDDAVEMRNASQAANDPSVVAYIGPLNSSAAKISIPLLNRAGVAMISPSNTFTGLTHISAEDPGAPGRFYPTGARTYFRVVSGDDEFGAGTADVARWLTDHGTAADRIYILYDGGSVDRANGFRAKARVLGLAEAGFAPVGDANTIGGRLAATNANAVYYPSYNGGDASTMIQVLSAQRPDTVVLLNEDVMADLNGLATARVSVWMTTRSLPNSALSGSQLDWLNRYRARYGEPSEFAIETYEATEVILAAIRRSAPNVTRASVVRNIAATRDYDGLLGRWSFSLTGDIIPAPLHLYTLRDGRLAYTAAGP